jgi:phosphonopyruvate decarboxylase
VEAVATAAGPDAAIVSTTGMMSRELYEHRVRTGQDPRRDFLTVGSMGHASQIALGVAAARPELRVVCLDGDGSVIMHMGGLATIGATRVENLTHVVVNNGVHDSVGGQPTVGLEIDLCGIARACGYRTVLEADTRQDLLAALTRALSSVGPTFLEVRVQPGARPDLGRPAGAPHENKARFMGMLRPGTR